MQEYDTAAPLTPPPPASPKRTPWGIVDMALAVGMIVVLTVLISIPAAVIGKVLAGDLDVVDDPDALTVVLLASLFLEVFILSSAAVFSIRKYHASWADLGLRLPRRGGFWLAPALVMSGLIIMYAYFGLLSLAGVEPDSDLPEQAFDNIGPVIALAVLSLAFAPVMEEIFFRGFIFGGLRGRWGTLWAALASGFLFGLAHIGNPGSLYLVPPITLVGAAFALGYAYSGSIVAAIVAHFLFNLFSFAVGLATS